MCWELMRGLVGWYDDDGGVANRGTLLSNLKHDWFIALTSLDSWVCRCLMCMAISIRDIVSNNIPAAL